MTAIEHGAIKRRTEWDHGVRDLFFQVTKALEWDGRAGMGRHAFWGVFHREGILELGNLGNGVREL